MLLLVPPTTFTTFYVGALESKHEAVNMLFLFVEFIFVSHSIISELEQS